MSGIDRIVVQDYVIDTIHYFDGDNNELARRLGIGVHCTAFHLHCAILARLVLAHLLTLCDVAITQQGPCARPAVQLLHH